MIKIDVNKEIITDVNQLVQFLFSRFIPFKTIKKIDMKDIINEIAYPKLLAHHGKVIFLFFVLALLDK